MKMENQTVQLVQETVDLPKESKEIKDCIVEVITKIKAGAKPAELVVAEFGKLQQAIEGYTALPAELKDKHEYVLAGLMAGQILAALKG
jgi:hypothetical protein